MLRLKWLEFKLNWQRRLAAIRRRSTAFRTGFAPWFLLAASLFTILKYFFLLTLPFLLLIRGAVYLYVQHRLPHWIAITGGVLFASLVVVLYFTLVYGRISGRYGTITDLKQRSLVVFVLVLGYSLHGLLFLSAANAKHRDVQNEYHQLHPILRLGIGTLVFLDEDLVITDADRKPEDYRKMGLPTKSRSLHYRQSSGYAHAIDIRTVSHGFLRNFLVKSYFQLMGFNTLRHSGTADHLHISLSSRDIPGGI